MRWHIFLFTVHCLHYSLFTLQTSWVCHLSSVVSSSTSIRSVYCFMYTGVCSWFYVLCSLSRRPHWLLALRSCLPQSNAPLSHRREMPQSRQANNPNHRTTTDNQTKEREQKRKGLEMDEDLDRDIDKDFVLKTWVKDRDKDKVIKEQKESDKRQTYT